MSLRPSERAEVAGGPAPARGQHSGEILKSRREESLLKKRCDGLPAAAAGALQMGHSSALQQKAVLSDDSAVRLEALYLYQVQWNGHAWRHEQEGEGRKDPSKPPQEGRVHGEFHMEFKEKNPMNKSVAAE